MKRLNGVWDEVLSFENLLAAFRLARRGKRKRPEVAAFELNLEAELFGLQDELASKTYQPGEYRLFTIYERKPRQIAAAPFRDRVVHHAVMGVVEPFLDRKFIFDSYACRKGKGVHAAVERYQGWARRYPYVLKMDVSQYFFSIDHDLLKEKIHRYIGDAGVMWLLETIIDGSPDYDAPLGYFPNDDLLTPLERRVGIPIGNLTSQLLANLYLNDLDHYLKEQLKVRAYLRYVDDLFVLGDSKTDLHRIRQAVETQLEKARLHLHPRKQQIIPVSCGVDVLGYYVFPYSRRLRNDNGHRFARRMKCWAAAYARGALELEQINPSIQSWIGHARHADTLGLRQRIFSTITFTREPA